MDTNKLKNNTNAERRLAVWLSSFVRCAFIFLWYHYFFFSFSFLSYTHNCNIHIKLRNLKYSYWQYWRSSIMTFYNCFCSGTNNIIFKINLSHGSMSNSKRTTIGTPIFITEMKQFCFMNSTIRSLFNISTFFIYFPSKSG